jgi:four helix bundle protein
MRDVQKLKVFELADALALSVYALSAKTPAEERFGLALQLRRAVAAAPLHLVEACGRGAAPEFLAELQRAQAAATTTRYLLSLARRIGCLSGPACSMAEDQCLHLIRALQALIKAERGRQSGRAVDPSARAAS